LYLDFHLFFITGLPIFVAILCIYGFKESYGQLNGFPTRGEFAKLLLHKKSTCVLYIKTMG